MIFDPLAALAIAGEDRRACVRQQPPVWTRPDVGLISKTIAYESGLHDGDNAMEISASAGVLCYIMAVSPGDLDQQRSHVQLKLLLCQSQHLQVRLGSDHFPTWFLR